MSQHLAQPRIRKVIVTPEPLGLRLVAPVRVRAKRTPFVVVVLALLSAGLVGLILMSTVLQQQSFQISALNRESKALALQEQALEREVAALKAPANVASRALTYGMVPNTNPVFLRLADGSVIGQPVPALPKSNVKRVDR